MADVRNIFRSLDDHLLRGEDGVAVTLLMQDPSNAVLEVIVDYLWFVRFNPIEGVPNATEKRARELYRRILEAAEKEQFAREDAA